MTTHILTRSTPRFEERSPPTLRALPSNENPISYQNLTIISRLSKDKSKFPIYLVTSKITGQNYAMKMFSDLLKDSYECYENDLRFALLSHPNVLCIASTDKNKTIIQRGFFMTKVTYVLLEYAPYGNLFDFIVEYRNEIDEKLARTYFRQLIDGLEYLHSVGITHLDLKPENLLIGADFNLKIADFDLSHIDGDPHIISRGTRMYRGPEFYNARSADIHLDTPTAADIYSAGIILFILKSGGVYPHSENRVIDGVNFTELMERDCKKFWTRHAEFQSKSKEFFDSKFKKLFRKMTKTNPKHRISIKKIKQSKWYNGPVYTPQELQEKMKSILKC